MMVAVLVQLFLLQAMVAAIALLTLRLSQSELDIQPVRRRSR